MRIIATNLLADLRVRIHSLKMSNFAYVEESIRSKIFSMVNNLPSAEHLLTLKDSPRVIEKISADIGLIMKMVDDYGTNSKERRDRYKSLTGLEPRYKHLEWKKAQVNTLVKISSSVDKAGCSVLSDDLLNLANKINIGKITSDDLITAKGKLDMHGFASYGEDLLKIAQSPMVLGPLGEPTLNGKPINQNQQEMNSTLNNMIKKDSYNAQEYEAINELTSAVSSNMDNVLNSSNGVVELLSAYKSSVEAGSNGENGQVEQSGQGVGDKNDNGIAIDKAKITEATNNFSESLNAIKSSLDALDQYVKKINGEQNTEPVRKSLNLLMEATTDMMGSFNNILGGEFNAKGNADALSKFDLQMDIGEFSKNWATYRDRATEILTVANETINDKNTTQNYNLSKNVKVVG